jgi:hypothetical protein
MSVPHSSLREHFQAGGLLAVLLLLYLGSALGGGRVMSPADALFETGAFADAAPPGFTAARNPLLLDVVYQLTPLRYLSRTALRDGHIPLWNPQSRMGSPLLGTTQAAAFYPINLLLLWLPLEQTFVWSAFLRLWIAGMGTYLLTRTYGLSHLAGLVAAVSFMLCGSLIVWLGYPLANVAVWLPALILTAERALTAPDRPASVRWLALLALVIGIQFTGGHMQTSVELLFTLGVYVALRSLQMTRAGHLSRLAWLRPLIVIPLFGVALGVCIAAVQVLPFLEWLPLSAEFHHRLAAPFRPVGLGITAVVLFAPLSIFHGLYSNPTWHIAGWPPWANFNEYTLYVGIVPLLVAVATLWDGFRKHPLVRVWAAIAGLTLGMALQLPIFDLINQLPLLSLAHPARLRFVVSFSVCILAAFGAEALWNEAPAGVGPVARRLTWLFAGVAACGLALVLFGLLILPRLVEPLAVLGRQYAAQEYARRATHTNSLEFYFGYVDTFLNGALAILHWTNVAFYMPALVAVAGLILVSRSGPSPLRQPGPPQVALLALIVVDLFSFGRDYNPSISTAEYYPPTPILTHIASDAAGGRVVDLKVGQIADAHVLYNVSHVSGGDYPVAWILRYLELIPGYRSGEPYGASFDAVDSPLLRVLNLRWVLAPPGLDLGADGSLRPLVRQSGAALWEVVDPWPRAFVVHDAILASTDDEAALTIQEKPDRIRDRVVLAADDRCSTCAGLSSPSSCGSDDVVLGTSLPELVQVTATTSCDGFLVVTDAYYPGWNAYLDGRRIELLRANIAFRAVRLPPGEHTVDFRYEPWWLPVAITVTLGALCFVLAMLLWSAWVCPLSHGPRQGQCSLVHERLSR